MKKILALICFAFICTLSQAQFTINQSLGSSQTLVTSKGGLAADSALILPSFADTTAANRSPFVKYYAGNMIRVGNVVYIRNSTAKQWLPVGSGGGSGVTSVTSSFGITSTPNPITSTGTIKADTTTSGLSGKYLRIIDTTAMLSPYQRSINAMKYSDTATMLSNYLNNVNYGLSRTGQVVRVDTATLSSKYLRIVDTTNKWVNNITRTVGKDSIIYYIDGNRYAIKDSVGGSSTVYVDSIYRTQGIDSIYYKKNGNTYAIKDSVGNVGGGGGGGKIYYFNGGVSMGTFGGIAMYELGDTAVTGTAANFTRATTGNIANFITDVNKPGLLQIPAGVWTIDTYLSEAGGGSNHAQVYAILEKWDGSTITTIATSPIEEITNGSTPDLYTYTISVPTTTLASTDRIIIQFYIQNTNGKTVTLYTQNGYVGEVHTTFTTGIGALNGLTAPSQSFATGTSGTDFNISSATSTHTFNLPTASATNRGALSSTDWSTFNGKIGAADTSVFQRKSISAYSFMANNTNAAANTTAQTFRTSGLQTYSGTITWTGSTAPSGTTNHTYNWTQIGNLVTMNITLIYGTASVLTTQVTMAWPSGAPTPIEQTGLGAANEILGYGSGQITTSASSSNSNFNRAMFRINPTDTGYELFLNCTAQAAYRYANITIQYFTNQ